MQALCDVDIVLTTYGIVSSEYSRIVRGADAGADAAETDDAGAEDADAAARLRNAVGTIFGVRFHRVVLDEAHMIKSRTTNVARGPFLHPVRAPWLSPLWLIHDLSAKGGRDRNQRATP